MNRIIISIFLCFWHVGLFGSDSIWEVNTYKKTDKNVYYQFKQSDKINNDELKFFPLFAEDSITYSSYNPFIENNPINIAGTDNLYWVIDLNKNVPVNDSVFFYYNIYTEGIDTISLITQNSNNEFYKKSIHIDHDFFQIPSNILLKGFKSLDNEEKSPQENDTIIQFIISIHKKEKTGKWNCIIGDCKIYEMAFQETAAKGFFFYELTQNLRNYPQIDPYKFKDYGIIQNPSINSNFSNKFVFKLSPELNQEKHTLQLLYFILSKYPFYKERNKNREDYLHRIETLISDFTLSFDEKIALISSSIKSLSDPHFYMIDKDKDKDNKKNQKLQLLITISPFFDGFYVTAISEGINNISIGDKIKKINDLNIDTSVEFSQINEIIKNNKEINILTTNGKNVAIQKREAVKYPPNYYKQDQIFKIINKKFIYFSLNNWNSGNYTFFTNSLKTVNLDSINHIIFDLRNNGGGDEFEAIRFISS